MKLSVKKIVEQEEELDITLPAFFRLGLNYVRIGEDQTIVKVGDGLAVVYEKRCACHPQDLGEIVKSGTPIDKLEFETKFAEYLSGISAAACVNNEMEVI